jgi:hypothetical protein
MAISIVNGFFCASSCDVSKAKRGEDPHPAADASKIEARSDEHRANRAWADQAVLFGGSLDGLSASGLVSPPDGVDKAGAPAWWTRRPTLDVLA